MTKSQYLDPVWLEQARLVSSFNYCMTLVSAANFEFSGFQKQKIFGLAYGSFRGNGQYGKIQTKEEPAAMLRFTSRLPCSVLCQPK